MAVRLPPTPTRNTRAQEHQRHKVPYFGKGHHGQYLQAESELAIPCATAAYSPHCRPKAITALNSPSSNPHIRTASG